MLHLQLPEEARELDKELRGVTKEKNEAVRGQDFEKVEDIRSHESRCYSQYRLFLPYFSSCNKGYV